MNANRTRDIIAKWAEYTEAGKFEESVRLMNPDGKWIVIGTSEISGTYVGPDQVLREVGGVLRNKFKIAPVVKCTHMIVEGNHGFLRGYGKGMGISGPYDQPYYAFYIRVENGGIAELIEFVDMVALETAAFGKKLVNA